MAGAATPQESNSGCWVIAIIAGLILSVSYCSEKKDTESDAVASMAVAAPVDAAGEPVIEPLSPSSITAGFEHFGKVGKAAVEGGAKIYSINCYASLAKTFSWATLDRCGGFDQAAVRTADLDTSYFAEDELEYFGSESAAERYLGVGTTAGLSGDEADTRLATLQKASADRRLPKRANAAAAPAVETIAEAAPDSPVMDEYTAEDELIGE
jgi:hypothetical protein